jgi:hypothetical protein
MLHPQQFEVNEAWIAFRLNGMPVRTERDGDFNFSARSSFPQRPSSLRVPSSDRC